MAATFVILSELELDFDSCFAALWGDRGPYFLDALWYRKLRTEATNFWIPSLAFTYTIRLLSPFRNLPLTFSGSHPHRKCVYLLWDPFFMGPNNFAGFWRISFFVPILSFFETQPSRVTVTWRVPAECCRAVPRLWGLCWMAGVYVGITSCSRVHRQSAFKKEKQKTWKVIIWKVWQAYSEFFWKGWGGSCRGCYSMS